jgi:hypothetical protein
MSMACGVQVWSTSTVIDDEGEVMWVRADGPRVVKDERWDLTEGLESSG